MAKVNWEEALSLYFIAGTQDVKPGCLTEVLQAAIIAGITCFQYREKGPGSLPNYRDRVNLARQCQELCRAGGIPFVINDELSLAIDVGADALHIGQQDTPVAATLAKLAPMGIELGLSTNQLADYQQAVKTKGISYVGVGPVFATKSKLDAQAEVGLELLRATVKWEQSFPKVAIGGINTTNSELVRETGVTGIAVIAAIAQSDNISQTVQHLLA